MIHVDVKKLGRIPDGGGHRSLGRVAGQANVRARNLAEGARKNRRLLRGYTFIHHAVDDHSRYVYSEILPDETKETASAFMRNAIAAFAAHGVKIQRVLTDNGSCYRSKTFAQVLEKLGSDTNAPGPTDPKPTAKSNASTASSSKNGPTPGHTSKPDRQACFPGFIEHYNHTRPHTALKGASPASRVTKLPG